MGARKLYQERILALIKNIPEEKLAEVVSIIENLKQDKTERYITAIEQGQGKFKNTLSSTEQFMKRKQQEKLIDK